MSTKFERGQKVRVARDAVASFGGDRGHSKFTSGFGWINSTNGPDSDGDYKVRISEDSNSDAWYVLGQYLTAVPEFPIPITFDEVKVGDTVRLSQDFGNGNTIVRTMTVANIDGPWLEPVGEEMVVGKSSTAYENATFELLARPEPKKAYAAGDVITRDEIKNLPNHTVITMEDAEEETVYIFVDGKLYNEMAVRLGGLRPEETNEEWTFTVRYVSEVRA